jgi:hypothetical protein
VDNLVLSSAHTWADLELLWPFGCQPDQWVSSNVISALVDIHSPVRAQ